MNLPDHDLTVYIDERPVSVRTGSCVRDAVAAHDREAATVVERGAAYVTDGVGRRVALDAPLESGAILRVVRSVPRNEGDKDE
jgi:hypothetical protein